MTFFNGHTVCIGDWVWKYDKEDFEGGERPIMNTPTWLDIYLIQNGKSEFVLKRMREVYSEETYKKFQAINLSSPPPSEYKQNRKIIIKPNKHTIFPLHNKPYDGGSKLKWWLQCEGDFGYCSETKVWSQYDNYYPHDTNISHIKSVKGVVRHLRKQYLPKGLKFKLIGRYVGEEYLIVTS